MVMKGMFMDGIYYAAVARNMAEGLGSFWRPYFSGPPRSLFAEHPPLVFYLESLFFRLFGDKSYTESIYCFSILLLTIACFLKIWQEAGYKEGAWAPLLLWIMSPVVYLAYPNNVLEPTLGLFNLFAVLLLMKADKMPLARALPIYFLAAILIICAALSKGPTALYALAVIPLLFMVYRRYSVMQAAVRSLFVIFLFGCTFLVLFEFYGPSKLFLHQYIEHQVVNSLKGQNNNTSHFLIFSELIGDLVFMAISIVAAIVYSKKKQKPISIRNKKNALFFLLVALCASLPIVISPKQMGFYAHPSLAFFALSAGCIISQFLSSLEQAVAPARKFVNTALIIAIVIALVYCWKIRNILERDAALLSDADAIAAITGNGQCISTDGKLQSEFSLIGYLARYHHISLNCGEHWLLARPQTNASVDYKRIPVRLHNLVLYEKTKSQPKTR
jgi:4-amino-4-deoxy-L-arabinose transferase-like glycosyltransferase